MTYSDHSCPFVSLSPVATNSSPALAPLVVAPAVLPPVALTQATSARVNARERTYQAWQDQTAGFSYVVADAMLKTGFSPDEIGKIGGFRVLNVEPQRDVRLIGNWH